MPKRTRTYASWQMQQLASPARAASYLNATLQESPELFLSALEKVAQASRSEGAAEAASPGPIAMASTYSGQATSTLDKLSRVLRTIGLQLSIVPVEEGVHSSPEPGIAPTHAAAHP